MKTTNTYKYLRVSYIINRVSFLHVHVSATLLAILREEAETCTYRRLTMFIIYDILICLYACVVFISVTNQLNALSRIF